MLLHRVLTALVLLPLVISGVLYLDTRVFALVLGVILLLGASEWSRLAGLETLPSKFLFLSGIALGMGGSYWLLDLPGLDPWYFGLVSLWWLGVTVALIRYRPDTSPVAGRLFKTVFGFIVLVPAWAALVRLHGFGGDGPALVLFVMSLTWVADTGAYFAGHRFGRNKLAPLISPGKTREGVYGALVGVALWGGMLAWLRPQTGPAVALVLFCLLVCVISVVGDLFESLLKRQANIKDSGNLLPGHGGVLDRIDSLTAVAPLFMFGILAFGGGQ
jgi:phosphatidate cytidylyltransferase